MAKFGRRYKLVVQGQHLSHTLMYPLTCSFNIEKKNFAMMNTAEFSIYGLSESSRKDIYFDTYFKKTIVPIQFFAGYQDDSGSDDNLPLIFSGNVIQAFTSREGPELVTHISALDGGFGVDTGKIPAASATVPAGWNFTSTMKTLMGYIDGVKPGQILVVPEPTPGTKAVTFAEDPWSELQKYTPKNNNLFIDNGVANMIGQNITLPGKGISTLSANTGLLSIPVRNGFLVTCQSLFEPNFVLGQALTLTSTITPWTNGLYKVIGLHHNGKISGVESGDARTDLSLLSSQAVLDT